MATYYWVGGNGNWDATTTTNWASSSGGAGGAGVPTSADSVIFDANSNTGTTAFAVTVTGTSASPAVCLNFTTGGAGGALDGAMTLTMGATAVLNCYGSMTLPATNFSVSATAGCAVQFGTTGSDTLTTNGVSFGATNITLIGTGTLTLGSALTTTSITANGGTFTTSNFNLSCGLLQTSGATAKTLNLGSSAITLSGATPINFAGSNLTFNAGTSTITCSNASPTFAGGGKTFYNVTFSSTALGTVTITGNNTFNNLVFTARAAAGFGQVALDAGGTTTVNGTLTLGSGTTGVARLWLRSVTVGSAHTLSVATLTAITDIDFRDITASGASSPWSGTRIGNALGNTNISFAASRTVYWNSTASANWNAAVWSTTSGNTGGTTTAFPLAQDTIVIDNAGLGTGNTITVNASYNIGTLDFSTRSNAATFATGTGSNPNFYGDLTYSSALTVSGTQTFGFSKQNGTATITSAGIAFTQNVIQQAPNGTVRINGALTLGSTNTYTLTQGTLDLTNNGAGNYTLTTGLFSSSNSNVRTLAFGTGQIYLTGNSGTIYNTTTFTNLTVTGTPIVNATYSGSTGTRSIITGNNTSATNLISVNITAGSDTINLSTSSYFINVNFTGFSGTCSSIATNITGNLTCSSTMTFSSNTLQLAFRGTSGTQQITCAGTTWDFPVAFNGVGGTFQLQDAMTVGSTQTVTLLNGTLDLNNKNLTCGLFSASGSNTRTIAFGTSQIYLTGNNGTILSITSPSFLTLTGNPIVNATYSGSVGTRTINPNITPASPYFTVNITAGTDTVSFASSAIYQDVNFTGFTGTYSSVGCQIYGNLTLNSGMTWLNNIGGFTFKSTTGIKTITTNGVLIDSDAIFNGIGGTWQLQDAMNVGSTRTVTLINGTVQLKSGTTNTVGSFVTSGTNLKALQSSIAGSQATLSQASGTVSVSYLSIKDSNATGGATWQAYTTNNNIDSGNNTGWDFGGVFVLGDAANVRLRSFTERGRD